MLDLIRSLSALCPRTILIRFTSRVTSLECESTIFPWGRFVLSIIDSIQFEDQACLMAFVDQKIQVRNVHVHWYRLVNKYIPQRGLMKMRRTLIDKTCLSSDVVSITFTYFLNSLCPSLKYPIQFILIDTPQNACRDSKNWSSSATWVRSSFSFTVGNK
jgi:hypothetical protein